jgi:transposase
MRRRKFSREFKFEAVRLVKDRGVSVAQAARDLDVHENVLRKWVRELSADPQQAFPGHGQIDRLRKEVAKLSCRASERVRRSDSCRHRTGRHWCPSS